MHSLTTDGRAIPEFANDARLTGMLWDECSVSEVRLIIGELKSRPPRFRSGQAFDSLRFATVARMTAHLYIDFRDRTPGANKGPPARELSMYLHGCRPHALPRISHLSSKGRGIDEAPGSLHSSPKCANASSATVHGGRRGHPCCGWSIWCTPRSIQEGSQHPPSQVRRGGFHSLQTNEASYAYLVMIFREY